MSQEAVYIYTEKGKKGDDRFFSHHTHTEPHNILFSISSSLYWLLCREQITTKLVWNITYEAPSGLDKELSVAQPNTHLLSFSYFYLFVNYIFNLYSYKIAEKHLSCIEILCYLQDDEFQSVKPMGLVSILLKLQVWLKCCFNQSTRSHYSLSKFYSSLQRKRKDYEICFSLPLQNFPAGREFPGLRHCPWDSWKLFLHPVQSL